MNNKITKRRIITFFTYDFLKVVAIAVIVCLVINIIFGVVSDKPSKGQILCILYSDDLIVGSDANKPLEKAKYNKDANKGYSYELVDIDAKQLFAGDTSSFSMLNTYAQIGEDDFLITSDNLARGYLEAFYAEDFDLYIENALKYLYDNNFYDESGNFNQQAVESYFDVTYKKDKRFKTSKQIEEGKIQEIKRIKTIYNNATLLKSVFKDNPQIFAENYFEFTIQNITFNGRYAIDVSKLSGGEFKVENAFKRAVVNTENNEVTYTSEGIYLMLGDNEDVNGHLHYENLSYLVGFLEAFSNLI